MSVIALLGTIILLLSGTHAAGSAQQNLVRFQAVVLDRNDARIANAEITIENRLTKHTSQSNDEGSIDVRMPPGSYQLIVEARGFELFRIERLEITKSGIEGMAIHLRENGRVWVIFEPADAPIVLQSTPLGGKIGPRRIEPR